MNERISRISDLVDLAGKVLDAEPAWSGFTNTLQEVILLGGNMVQTSKVTLEERDRAMKVTANFYRKIEAGLELTSVEELQILSAQSAIVRWQDESRW